MSMLLEPPQSAHRPARSNPLRLAALLALTACLDLLYYTGYYASDDIEYLTAAHEILHSGSLPAQPSLGQIRLSPVLYCVAVAALVGFRTPLIAAAFVLFHLLLVLQTWQLGKRWHDAAAGWLAAAGVALLPMLVLTSTMILPDNLMACCLLAALALCDASTRAVAAARPARALLQMTLCGLCVGLGYAAKESALVAIPLLALAWLGSTRRAAPSAPNKRSAPRWRLAVAGVLSLCFGVALVFAVEWSLLSTFVGRPYTRMAWTVGEDSFSAGLQSFPAGRDPWVRLHNVWSNVTAPWFSKIDKGFILLGPIAYLLIRGRRVLPLAFVLWYFAYHTWGSTKLTQYLPTTLQVRYYTPILPLIAIMTAHSLLSAYRFVTSRAPALKPALIVIASLAGAAYFAAQQRRAAFGAEWLYRGDIVRPALRAAEIAWTRPTVFSGTLTRHLRALFLDATPPAEFSDDLDPARIDQWLDEGGFVYFELQPESRLKAVLRRSPLDAQLHPALFPGLASQPTSPASTAPTTSLEPLRHARVNGRPVLVEQVGQFYCPRSRWHELLQAIGLGEPDAVDKNKRSSAAYRVYTSP